MKSYVVYDREGNILRTGDCNDDDLEMQSGDGECVIEGHADDVHDVVDTATGEIKRGAKARQPSPFDVSPMAAAKPTYADTRRMEYPHLSDFADAIYWAERGDRTKLDNWLARCDAVKAAYPKES